MAKNIPEETNKLINVAETISSLLPKEQIVTLFGQIQQDLEERSKEAKKMTKDYVNKGTIVAREGVEKIAKIMEENLDQILEKAGIPSGARKMMHDMCKEGIEIGKTFANGAIDKFKDQGIKALSSIMEQMMQTVKVVLENVGDLAGGKKTKTEFIDNVKGAWQEAGKRMEATKEKETVKPSKIKEILANGAKSKEQSFVQAVNDKSPTSTRER